MNYLINSFGKWYRANAILTIPVTIAVVLILGFLIWYKASSLWNGVGNMWFAAKMSWQGRKLESELNSAAEQKKEIEQTLVELAKSKETIAAAAKEREIRDRIFNDANKTAKEKVAAYEAAMQGAPVVTDPTGVTTNDLCERAVRMGSSQQTIDALCGPR